MSYKKFSLCVSAVLLVIPWMIITAQQPTGSQANNATSNQGNKPSKNGVADQSGSSLVQAETLRASDDTTAVKIEVTAEPIQALPQPNAISKDGEAHGAANLSLQSEAVTPGSYIQTGIGPAVAGRPNTANNFEINGIDNNSQTAPAPLFPISNEAVTNFTIVQGDTVSQLAHSTGGQLNQIVTQGTNLWHGGIYDYLNTRKLNAVEPSLSSGLRTQRYDQNRMGLNAGGPLVHDKLFAFVNLEYLPLRASRVQVPPIFVPTAAGYAAAAGIAGLSAVNLNVLGTTAGVATTATTFTTINGTVVPLGPANTEVRVSSDQVNGIANFDWNMGSASKASLQYGHYDVKSNSFGTTLPGFQVPGRSRAMFGAVSYTGAFDTGTTFSANLGYNRSEITAGDGDFAFAGLSAFPSIEIQNVGLALGTDFATRRVRSNMYQFGGWAEQAVKGHRIRTGADIRILNSAFGSLGSDSGILGYSTLERFLLDLPPDAGAQRSFGNNSFSGNRVLLNAFLQDRMRYRGINIDAGLSAQYSQLPASIRRQTDLVALNVPGVIDFGRAWPDRINLAPQIGVSFSPGTERVTIRSGFGMLYDALGTANGFVSSQMPFTTLSAAGAASTVPGFLANGGLAAPLNVANGVNTVAFDQQLPYIEHWNAGVSYVLFGRLTAEVKYLGNHGVHQAEQTILNNPTGVSAAANLPVFFTNPGLPVLNSLTLTQAALLTQPNAFTAAGFTNPILATRNDGTSWYNAAVLKLNQRFSGGTQVTGQYTWADARADTTGTSLDLLYGRRMEQSLWGRKHRATLTPVIDISYLTRNWTGRARNASNNLTVTATLTYERGARVPLFNGMETGFVGIPAGTGIIVNPAGVPGTSTGVLPLTNSAGQVVAYQALNPNAQFVAGGPGTFSTERPTFRMDDTRNIDLSIVKKFAIGHTVKLEARGDAFNLFNRPQFTGLPISTLGNGSSNIPGFLLVSNPQFNNLRGFVSANPRTVQLALHVSF